MRQFFYFFIKQVPSESGMVAPHDPGWVVSSTLMLLTVVRVTCRFCENVSGIRVKFHIHTVPQSQPYQNEISATYVR